MMKDLKFQSVKHFNNYSIKVANGNETVKLNPLRISMAKADGYQTVESYRDALDNYEAYLARFISGGYIFLTGGSMQVTEFVTPALMNKLNSPYQKSSDLGDKGVYPRFYPLMEDEAKFLSSDGLIFPQCKLQSLGHSAYYRNNKYLVLCFEINSSGELSDEEASVQCESLKHTLNKASANLPDSLISINNLHDTDPTLGYSLFECDLLIPFTTLDTIADDAKSLQEHLVSLFCAVYCGLGDKNFKISEDELSTAIELSGRIDYHKKLQENDCPFELRSSYYWEWLSGWHRADNEKALPELLEFIDGIKGPEKETAINILDDLVHQEHEKIANAMNPYDEITQNEDWDHFDRRHSLKATEINNQGIEKQLKFLLTAMPAQLIKGAFDTIDSITYY